MHDAGKILNPMIADGQILGAFAQGIATALYEEFVTNEEGAFLTGTFADYLVPTVERNPAGRDASTRRRRRRSRRSAPRDWPRATA